MQFEISVFRKYYKPYAPKHPVLICKYCKKIAHDLESQRQETRCFCAKFVLFFSCSNNFINSSLRTYRASKAVVAVILFYSDYFKLKKNWDQSSIVTKQIMKISLVKVVLK